MTVLLKRILVFEQGGVKPVEITDDERITIKLAQGGKGSTMDIILKNAWSEHVTDGEFKFKVNDIVKIWLKYATEGTDEIDTNSNTDLFMVADVINVEAQGAEKKVTWILRCMDRSFLLLNSLWAKNYPLGEGKTSPVIIKEIINVKTGTGNGVLGTELKANLAEGSWNTTTGVFTRTGGGFIQNTRPDNSFFPTVAIAKVFKPVYEWIDDLGQPDLTNTSAETSASGSPPAARPYIFFIDEDNNCHWEFPDSTTPAYHMTWGQTAAVSPDTDSHYIKSFTLKKAVYDIVNMVIFNAGNDFFGSGILDYYYDPTTKSPKLKPVYKPWIDIADTVIQKEILDENAASYAEDNATPGTLTWHDKRYTGTYSLTPHWSGSSVANDAALNTSLRNQAILLGKTRASRLTQNKANPRWQGKISIRGEKINLGESIQFNSADHGIVNAKVRVTDILHSISPAGWDTNLTVEEDALAITNS